MNKKNVLLFVVIVVIILLITIFIKFPTKGTIDKNNKTNKTIENPFSYSSYINSNWNIKIPNPQENDVILEGSGTGSILSQLQFSNNNYEEFKNSIEWIDAGHQSEYYIDDFIKYVSDTNLEQKQSDKEKYILLLQDLRHMKINNKSKMRRIF